MKFKAKLKDINKFLDMGWIKKTNYLEDSERDYGIELNKFGKEFTVTLAKDTFSELEYWDNSGTSYKKIWFEYI